MERLYRVILFGLFILGFLGAVASADYLSQKKDSSKDLISMIRDIKLAQEINDFNTNNWNQNISDINEDGLSRVEALLTQGDESSETVVH